MKATDFDVVKGMRQMTMVIRIKNPKEFALRMWAAIKLFRLAAFVMNTNLKIESEPAE